MKKPIVRGCIVALLLIGLSACDKKSGEAVVLAKEHIEAALPTTETPNTESTPNRDEQLRPMADDEIAVDGYVMKAEARGTSRDPRTLKHEQWIVKLRENDRIKVRYRTGKYTGTVWAAEIE